VNSIRAKFLDSSRYSLLTACLAFSLASPNTAKAFEIVGYPSRASIDQLGPHTSSLNTQPPQPLSNQRQKGIENTELSPETALEIARQFMDSVGTEAEVLKVTVPGEAITASDEEKPVTISHTPIQTLEEPEREVALSSGPISSARQSSQNAMPMPSLRFSADDVDVAVSRNSSSLTYSDPASKAEVRIGLGYGGVNAASGISVSAARLIQPDLALGATLEGRSKQSDLSINLVSQLDPASLLSLSLGHMWGRDTFNFFSGAAESRISQSALAVSYLGSVDTSVDSVSHWGISAWGARANQGAGLAPVTHTIETATSYDTYLDPRKLSEGRLLGASLSFQHRQGDKFLLHPSVGYERLEFPFADGTRETHERPTASLEMQYTLDSEARIKWASRYGVAERRSSVGMNWKSWSIDAFYSEGLQGLKDNKGVSILYSLSNSQSRSHRRSTLNRLDERNTPSSLGRMQANGPLLNAAMSRPSVFPRVWLTKVDNTAVTLIQSSAKVTTTTSWTTTASDQVYFDSGTPNRASISFNVSATSNDGSAVTYAWGSDPDNLQSVLTLNTITGVISGNHSAVATDKTYRFNIVATANGISETSNDFTLTIKAPVRVRFTTAGATVELGTVVTTSTSITFPPELTSTELLIVGGGGAGGGDDGGGGGGGGAVGYSAAFPVTGGQTVSLSIGAGGLGSTARGQSGSATVFGSLSAPGGGGGGQSNPDYEGISGGSGGGASQSYSGGGPGSECGTTTLSGVTFQCSAGGGTTSGGLFYGGSGGGGATGVGLTASNNNGVSGGAGRTLPASLGTGVVAAGGGGGGAGLVGNTAGYGGNSVGGDGGTNVTNAGSAAEHTGSGGGGGGLGGAVGGNGSGGLIILRY
jgi:hypothetical protein